MVELIVVLIILFVLIIAIAAGVVFIKKKVEEVSQSLFGVKSFFEGFNVQKETYEAEPKTPYGMENLILPDLTKDFPYMHVEQMKAIADESIMNYLKSIERKEIQQFNNPSDKLIKSIEEVIHSYRKYDIKIEDINLHKTVVNKYEKNSNTCTLIFQTALGYKFTRNGTSQRIEERVNTSFIYVFDDKGINLHESISLHCPSCGAPIKGLGHKVCPYCNSGLIDIAPKTWKLNSIDRLKT